MADTWKWQGAPSSAAPASKFLPPQIHNLGDLLDWQRAALQEAIFRKGTSDANRAALRAKLASIPPKYAIPVALLSGPPTAFYLYGARHYNEMPQVLRGLYDTLLDTATDPLTVESLGVSPEGKAVLKLVKPLAKPIASTLGKLALKAAPELRHIPEVATRILNDLIVKPLNFAGHAIAEHGRGPANEAIGMLNRQAGEEREIFRRLDKLNSDITKGLSPKQLSAVQKIMHGQLPDSVVKKLYALDPQIEKAVKARTQLTDAIVRLQERPGGGLSGVLQQIRGGKLPPLPPELQRFAGRPGEFGAENLREHYFPARGQALEVEPNRPARDVNLLESRNPHLREQQDFNIPSSQVQHFEDAFRGMLKSSARAISTNRVKAELKAMYPQGVPPAILSVFDKHVPATGMARTGKEMAQDFFKGVVALPKIGIVGTSPIHMFNILALLLAHDPSAVPRATQLFWNVLRSGGDEGKRFDALLPMIEKGIDISTHEKGGTVLSKMPLNRVTWDWDAAAKGALAEAYIRKGYKPLDAGVRAANDLVNYRNTSPVTAALRYFMPFATFAEGGAKSVGSALVKHPAQMEFVNRLTGGRFLGGGDSTTYRSYQPPADVGRGLPNYLRSKTSDLVKLPLALATRALPGGRGLSGWMLSGRSPGGTAMDILTSPVPYARDVLNLIPLPGGKTIRGYKPDTPENSLLYQATGIGGPTKPATPAAAPSKGLWYLPSTHPEHPQNKAAGGPATAPQSASTPAPTWTWKP